MRRLLLATIAMTAMAPLAAPATGWAQDLPTQNLRIALNEDGDILDPTLARTFVGRIVFAGLCDKLFDINEKLEIVPQLATGYEYTDPKTIVLHLRPGVTLHDGTEMDAAAVKYSLDRHATLTGSARKGEVASMDHVEVVDKLTVKIVLKAPSAPFIAQLTDRAGMIVSPKAAEAAGKDFGLHPVCAGPFSFAERVANDHITLDRFPGYWDAKNIHFAHVTYRIITDTSVKLANLQAGAVDIAERVAPSDVGDARKDPKITIAVYPSLGYDSINVNIDNGPRSKMPLGQSKLVRKAFELSLDRNAMMQVLNNGLFKATVQAIPSSSPYFNADLKVPERDVAKAKALLAQAGVKTPVPVTLGVTTSPLSKQLGEIVQSMAAEAGFEVKVQATEFASLLSAETGGDYEATNIGWSGRPDPDGNLYSFMVTGGPLNDAHYSNKDVDAWLEASRATTDFATRKALFAKIVTQIEEDLPVIYLDNDSRVTGMSKKISGFREVPDGMVRLQGLSLAK